MASAALQGAILFTPGDRLERFEKGWVASGGRLILDLEDAVAPERKPAAREAVARWLRETGRQPLLRVNATDSEDYAADRAVLGGSCVAGVIVPKVNAPSDLDPVRAAWPAAALLPLIETAQGLEAATTIARAPGVCQLLLGALDLHAECGVDYPHPALLEHARLRLLLASRAANIEAPIDSPHPGLHDMKELSSDAQAAAKLGFAGKLCIHPAQVARVTDAFLPTQQQLEWAREVMAAITPGIGAVPVRGRMVDAPVVAWAKALLMRDR